MKGWKAPRGLMAVLVAAAVLAAQTPAVAVAAAEKPTVTLEQAIQTVKSAFDVPEAFNQFSSGYNEYDGRQAWTLSWRDEKQSLGYMEAEVNAETGEILNVRIWMAQNGPNENRIPAVSRQNALGVAQDLIKKLQADRLGELELRNDNQQLLPLTSWGPATYSFYWQRINQGVPFPQDGVTIDVDTQTGKVTNYSYQWSEGALPDASRAISAQQARQAFGDAGMLSLQYVQPTAPKPGDKVPVLLVYRLDHPSNGVIDALNGKPLELESGGLIGFGAGGMEAQKRMNDSAAPAEVPLTPEETKEIIESGQLTTQEEALKAVSKWVEIPRNLELTSASLQLEQWTQPPVRTWNFNWQDTDAKDDQYSYMIARVNASTGELLSFDIDPPRLLASNSSHKITRTQAQAKAEAFLKKINPELFEQVRLIDATAGRGFAPEKDSNSPYQYFTYRRVVNGIDFSGNDITVRVETATGRVLGYGLNWSELEFPDAEGTLNADQSCDKYLARQPLTLQYCLAYQPDGKKEIRLVYRPVPLPGVTPEAFLDAFTGQALDWTGNPVPDNPQPVYFDDIAGNWAENEIALLGQAGVFAEYGTSFHPNEGVTAIQVLRAMLAANDGQYALTMPDKDVIQRAKDLKWVEDIAPGDAVSRDLLAKLMVRFLGLEKAAKAKGVFTLPVSDAASIGSNSFGYAALTYGLGILNTRNGKASLDLQATRAEAAYALTHALSQ